MALASMGIYVFETRFLMEQLRRDARPTGSSRDFGKDIIPYIVKNGTAWAHRFPRSCVRSSNEEVAYWRDVGTIDAYWKANIDLTDVNPQLDLYDRDWPIWTYAEITPPAKFVHDFDGRRGSAVNSLVSGDCIISGGSLDRRCCRPARASTPIRELHEAVVLPYCDDRPRRAAQEGRGRSRRRSSPRGWWSARIPSSTPVVPPHRRGRHAHHPADDRQVPGEQMIEVLSVASEAYPLIKTGGLADVTGALPAALAPLGVTMRTLLPGYPAVMRAARRTAASVAEFDELLRRPGAAASPGGPAGSTSSSLDAPHLYDRPGNPYLGPDGKDWPDNWRRFAALSYVAGRARQRAGRGLPAATSSTPTTGRRASCRPMSSTAPPTAVKTV